MFNATHSACLGIEVLRLAELYGSNVRENLEPVTADVVETGRRS
jgi:hypothetical protein